MSEQVILDREAPPWAQRLQTDINSLMTRLDRRVKTVNNTLSTGTTSLQGQINTLITDLDTAELAISDLQTDVGAIPLLVSGTYTPTTSGTSVDFTGLPAGIKRITIGFNDVGTNGTSDLILQLGDSGGVETTGYYGSAAALPTGSSLYNTATNGLLMSSGWGAANVFSGVATLVLVNPATNTWSSSGSGSRGSASGAMNVSCGIKSLSATLDRIRLTTETGVNTFDAGGINILYEQ